MEAARGIGGPLTFLIILAAVVALVIALVIGGWWLLGRASTAAHAVSLKDIALIGVALLAVIAWQLARRT